MAKLAKEKGFNPERLSYFKTDDSWYVALGKSSQLKVKPIYASIKQLNQLQAPHHCEKVTWGSTVVS